MFEEDVYLMKVMHKTERKSQVGYCPKSVDIQSYWGVQYNFGQL